MSDFIHVPKIDPEYSALKCPSCGEHYLHHTGIHVYARTSEDSAHGTHLSLAMKDPSAVNGKADESPIDVGVCDVRIDTNMLGNPSDRRGGIAIGFWCENCHCEFDLTVAQHKGTTLVRAEVIPDEGSMVEVVRELSGGVK